jgi:hypothetical protein
MRVKETWIAVSPSKRTVIFSLESEDVWFAVSEEDMTLTA